MSGTTQQLVMSEVLKRAREALASRQAQLGIVTPAPSQDPRTEAVEAKNAADIAIQAIKQAGQEGFQGFAQRLLKIRLKSGKIVPFTFNPSQIALQAAVDAQRARLGYVRQIVLKGRQQGISTYITGRGYYRVSRAMGQKALTIAHEVQASKNLHGMVKTYHDFMDARFKPRAKRSNDKELVFAAMRSEFKIATAKNLSSGRSDTVQHFHGSEVAFWPNAAEIMKGAMQAIGMIPDTEIWLESTAKGTGNYYHNAVSFARKGLGDFEFTFLPWTLEPGYSRVIENPQMFEDSLDDEDRLYMKVHGLTVEQMAWREAKIQEQMLQGTSREAAIVHFGGEYPATIEEAFNTDTGESFMRAVYVILARQAMRRGDVTFESQHHAPIIMGVDPSWKGNDKFSVWIRRGRFACRACPTWQHKSTTESVGLLLRLVEKWRPDSIHVDANGVGAGVYDLLCERLEELSLGGVVMAVMAGGAPEEPDRYVLKRDECWGRMKDWFMNAPQVAITDDDAIQSDLTNIKARNDSRNRLKMESKDDMRKPPRSLPSPDDGDALSLTFAYAQPAYLPRGGRSQVDPNRPYDWRLGVSR